MILTNNILSDFHFNEVNCLKKKRDGMKRRLTLGSCWILMIISMNDVVKVYRIDNEQIHLNGINDVTYQLQRDEKGSVL